MQRIPNDTKRALNALDTFETLQTLRSLLKNPEHSERGARALTHAPHVLQHAQRAAAHQDAALLESRERAAPEVQAERGAGADVRDGAAVPLGVESDLYPKSIIY